MEDNVNEQLIAVFVGIVAIPVINFVKGEFGWDGAKALLLSGVLSGVGAIVVMLLGGNVDFSDFDLDKFVAILPTVFATAQAIFQAIKIARERG